MKDIDLMHCQFEEWRDYVYEVLDQAEPDKQWKDYDEAAQHVFYEYLTPFQQAQLEYNNNWYGW